MLCHTVIASPDSEPSTPSWMPSTTPVRHLAPVRRALALLVSALAWTPRRPALTQHPSILSLSLSRSRQAKAPSPLPPRASQAPRTLASASCRASERLQVRLELLHLLHPSVGRDLPEVSDILRVRRRRVHGRRDPDSGEPRRCSILASFLPSESCQGQFRSWCRSASCHCG